MKSVKERFFEKVNFNGPTMPHMTTPCHEWMGARSKKSKYGRFNFNGRIENAQRVALILGGVDLKEDECGLHHCDNHPCVRFDHLYKGDKKNNAQDRERRGRSNHATGERHGCSTHPGLRRGEGNSHAKLTEDVVRSVIVRLKNGEKQADIARDLDLTRQAIFGIDSGKTWKHVER